MTGDERFLSAMYSAAKTFTNSGSISRSERMARMRPSGSCRVMPVRLVQTDLPLSREFEHGRGRYDH